MSVAFRCTTHIAASPEVVFDRSLDVDVHVASMTRSGERAISGVTSGQLGLGDEVTWRARHFGIVFRMTSRITSAERPHVFVDEQVQGPFQRFRHEHRFVAGDGGTDMIDVVEFSAPFGLLGRLAERWVLDRYLRRLIADRNAYLVRACSERG